MTNPDTHLSPSPNESNQEIKLGVGSKVTNAIERFKSISSKAKASIRERSRSSHEETQVEGIFPTIDVFYKQLVLKEEVQPDMDEIIGLKGITEDSVEFGVLTSHGIDRQAISNGRVKRGELVGSGYVFLNRIGGGEKPILNAVIPSTHTDSGSLDLGMRLLLTQEELDEVRSFQEKSGGFVSDIPSDILRKDMLAFLMQSTLVFQNKDEAFTDAFAEALNKSLSGTIKTYTDEEAKKVINLLAQNSGSFNMRFLMDWCMHDLPILTVRGEHIDVYGTRYNVLNGSPSPFLKSGYHFDQNLDVTIHPRDPLKTRRLNMVVLHLLSEGINEMGASTNNSHDQQYVTAAEFGNNYFIKDEGQRNKKYDEINSQSPSLFKIPASDEILGTIQQRLLIRAQIDQKR